MINYTKYSFLDNEEAQPKPQLKLSTGTYKADIVCGETAVSKSGKDMIVITFRVLAQDGSIIKDLYKYWLIPENTARIEHQQTFNKDMMTMFYPLKTNEILFRLDSKKMAFGQQVELNIRVFPDKDFPDIRLKKLAKPVQQSELISPPDPYKEEATKAVPKPEPMKCSGGTLYDPFSDE